MNTMLRKMTLALLLCVAGVATAWAQMYAKGRLLTAEEINAGGVEVILCIPHASFGIRYYQSNAEGFRTLYRNGGGNDALTAQCVFIVEQVEGGIVLKNKSLNKYIAADNPSNAVEDVASAAVFEAQSTNSSDFDGYFGRDNSDTGLTPAEQRAAAIRFLKKGTGNFLNGNGLQYYSGEGVWSASLVHEAVVDYSTHYSDRTERLNRDDRYPRSFTLTNSDNVSVTHTWGTADAHNYVYVDDTDFEVVIKAGSTFTVSIDYVTAGPMHSYAYVDYGQDGFFAAVAPNGGALEDNDLVAFSKYNPNPNNKENDKNSLGETPASGNFPGFPNGITAPTAPGKYRMRLKIDWNDIDPKGRPASGGNSTISNGGGIIDFTLNVVETISWHTANFVNENDESVEGIPILWDVLVAAEAGKIPVESSHIDVLDSQNFQLRPMLSITANGNTYDSWEALNAAVTAPTALTIKVGKPALTPGKYYAFKHAGNTNRYIEDYSTNLQAHDNQIPSHNGKYVFRVEAATADEATGIKAGMFYLHNVGTGRYVKRTGASGISNNEVIPTVPSLDPANCAYYITNGLVSDHEEIYGIADAMAVPNPVTGIAHQRYLHCNDGNKVVRWSTAHGVKNNSHWYIEEVELHPIALSFTVDGNPADNIYYTMVGAALEFVAGQQILSCLTDLIVSDSYSVISYELNGTTYTSKADFLAACHAVADDNAQATVNLHDLADEVDVTIALWKTNGTFYDNDAESESYNTTHGEWRFNAQAADAKVRGNRVPNDLDLRLVAASEGAQIGGHINGNGSELYHYGQHNTSDPDGLTFLAAPANSEEAYKYTLSLAEQYYILQYEVGFTPNSVTYPQLITNDGGGRVLTAKPDANATKYTITDTPASNETSFYLKLNSHNVTDQPSMAVFFQVRVVNRKYLEEHQEVGLAIVEKALAGKVGFPLGEEEDEVNHEDVRSALRLAKEAYLATTDEDENEKIGKYCEMLQAYSRYISCRHLQMPEDCSVYNVSFIDLNGDKHLIAQNADGLELIDYIPANCQKKEARWISHEENGKLFFVNKKTGDYAQANITGDSHTGCTQIFHEDDCAFTVQPLHQDINDYMMNVTDEKLLGAVYLTTNAGPQARPEEGDEFTSSNQRWVMTYDFSIGDWANESEAWFMGNKSSAVAFDLVEEGETYNGIKFREASDGKFYSTYCGFYPVAKPDDAEMYYVTEAINGYLHLQKVQADVIRPNFPVILISDNADRYKNNNETHLHLGMYTAAMRDEIEANLATNGQNILQGTTTERVCTADIDGTVYVLSGGKYNNIGFYQYTGTYLPLNKAYYVHPENAEIRGFLFYTEDGEETRVELTEAEQPQSQQNAVIYDLSGRRVANAKKGIFIINGKKVCL